MRKSAKLGLYGIVLAGMVGGTAAWASNDRAVAVSVDGQARTVHTKAATVAGALKSGHITIGAHDVLAPSGSSALRAGTRIVVLRGRLLHLDVNGRRVDVWTTAPTVSAALAELGYGTGDTVSVSRSTRLPLTPTQITLLTPKAVTIHVDNSALEVITTDRTAGQAIAAAGVVVGARDRVSVAATSALRDGEVITISRVRTTTKTVTKSIPFTTKTTKDETATLGTTTVVSLGHKGVQKISYQLVYVDGKLAGTRLISTVVVHQAVAQVQKVGTKKVAVPTPTKTTTGSSSKSTGSSSTSGGTGPAPKGSAQDIAKAMLAARGWGGDQFSCLVSLWNRESGWRTNAANPSGAYGIPQAVPGSKMASAGPNWRTDPTTQITWGLGYISARYGTPCGAWAHSQSQGWY